ncbi:hypothetical protein D8Y22_22200 [Salinadaptatus halalkaliphilus]|uniref:Uncharacterized protein n=1 Tax=Salinadaptatus halalkaliphilus TaxID=2419781 RepID=A0A4S3TFU7_9EURY|nr:hypothetical protein [Salinadaptatus halalkaliphilus]THE62779.1 hypothetical protein D8Y22_22200 [Salinadaptatus halalkaliphilus]
MSDEDSEHGRDLLEDDPTDSFDLEHSDRVQIGVTRGETDLEMGPPREYPDRGDVSVRPASVDDWSDRSEADSNRLVLSVDAMAGDHATGHADVVLTPAEASTLASTLSQTVRWMTETNGETDTPDDDF